MSTPYATFEPGSVVFEPFLGLCRVTHSSQETMLGVGQLFYQLQSRQGSAVVKVPASQMVSRGIRPLLTVDQIEFKLGSESEHLPQDDTEPVRNGCIAGPDWCAPSRIQAATISYASGTN